MLRVYNLPPEPTLADWIRAPRRLLLGLAGWALVMLWISSNQQVVRDAWYNVSTLEGAIVLSRTASEEACKANVSTTALACVSGYDLVMDKSQQAPLD